MSSDDELFAEIVRRRGAGEDHRAQLGELLARWRDPSNTVVRRVQGAWTRGSPDDADEIFQDAVGKFITRGLDQFRGISEQMPGKAASVRTFFLRIVKHCAIDRYRRQREDLDDGPPPGEEDDAREDRHLAGRAAADARAAQEQRDASEEYWAAFRRLQDEHPNEATAWDLYHHQDVDDHQECARLLGISVANSYKRVSRAQAWLKLYLLEAREREGV